MSIKATKEGYPVYPDLAGMLPVNMVFDIGCESFEWSTQFLRQAFPDATIYGFEPDPRHAVNVLKEQLDAKLGVRFQNYAVSDHDGACAFWPSVGGEKADWTYSGSTRKPTYFENVPGQLFHFKKEPITINCVTLDSFCLKHGVAAIDYINLDVQGAEGDVLRGAVNMIPRTRYIYAEHNSGGCHENEPGLSGILALLPDWEVVCQLPYDVLLKNTKL